MYVEYNDRVMPTLAQVQRASVPCDEYAQCGACGWTGCAADLQGHRQAKHSPSDVSCLIYRR